MYTPGGVVPEEGGCRIFRVFAVRTVTIIVEESVPGITDWGVTLQMAKAGAPSHAKFTTLEKEPPIGVTLSL